MFNVFFCLFNKIMNNYTKGVEEGSLNVLHPSQVFAAIVIKVRCVLNL